MRRWLVLFVAIFAFGSGAWAADAPIGVVLLHGKWGAPSGQIAGVAAYLKREGFLVETPEMPWSGRREYDAGMDTAMAEVDAAVQALRNAGAKKIAVAGHSMGANAALHYAGRNKVDGVISLALGHFPEGAKIKAFTEASLARARDMRAAGNGKDSERFEDFNSGNRTKTVKCPANSYLSYFDPDGPMNTGNNARAVKPDTPVLWIVGSSEDPAPRRAGDRAHAALPANAANKFIVVPADHLNTPDAAKTEIAQWLKSL